MDAHQASGSLLLFRAAGRRLAIPAAQVREIDRPRRLTPVPNAPDSLLGLTNLRGTILPVISMARLLDAPPEEIAKIIVIENAKPFALAVDQVEAVVGGDDGSQGERIDVDDLVTAQFAGLAPRPAARGERVRAARKSDKAATGRMFTSFLVAGQEFALPLPDVAEIIALPADIALLPQADPAVIGSAAWRGSLLPVLSLASLLALPEFRSRRERVVVTRIGDHRVGLLVEAMRDVITVDPDLIDHLPPVLARGGGEARIDAIARLDAGRRLISILSSRLLVDETMTGLLLTGNRADVELRVEKAEETRPILLFRLGTERFGLPLDVIDEVRRLASGLTRLPRAPDFVRGVINLRDHAVPVIDQGDRFGTAPSDRRHLVVASNAGLQAAFLVDAIIGVARCPISAFKEIPAVGDAVFDHVVDIDDGDRLTLIFSAFELLASTERAMLAAFGTDKAHIRP